MASHNHYSFAETASDIHSGTHDPVALILSQDDLRNTTFDCDSAGIHYRIETPTKGIKLTRTTKLYRWDRRTNGEVLVAEWEQNWGTDKMRFLRRADMSQELVPVSNFIKKSCGWLSSRCVHVFFETSNDGVTVLGFVSGSTPSQAKTGRNISGR